MGWVRLGCVIIGLVKVEVDSPVSLRDGDHRGPEAVCMIPLITAVTEKQLLLVVSATAKLADLVVGGCVRHR